MADIAISVPAVVGERGRARAFLRELVRSKTGLLGLGVLVIIGLSAVLAPVIAPADPTVQSLGDRVQPPLGWGGTLEHPLGTDQLGRDLLSRILFGARVSMYVGVAVVVLAGSFGVTMGIIAGYRGGFTDTLIMRLVDTQLAFPGILLALVILYALGASVNLVVVVLAINGWMVYARLTRGMVLSLREQEYVEAAEIGGARPLRIMTHHLLPNLTSPILTLSVLEFARYILAEAALSFLGYGIQPPNSSWGLIIAQGQSYITSAWWLVTIPGVVIALTVLSSNLFASWLRVYADPRQREKQLGGLLTAQTASQGVGV